MVGHLIRYHAAFIELQKQLAAGIDWQFTPCSQTALRWDAFGQPDPHYLIYAHDLSLILELVGNLPTTVHCVGASHITPGVVDFMTSSL